MVIAALSVELVVPGGGGDVVTAILVLEDFRQVMAQHSRQNEWTDVLAHAVVQVGVPSKRLLDERLPAHEDIVGLLAFENLLQLCCSSRPFSKRNALSSALARASQSPSKV